MPRYFRTLVSRLKDAMLGSREKSRMRPQFDNRPREVGGGVGVEAEEVGGGGQGRRSPCCFQKPLKITFNHSKLTALIFTFFFGC